jgi:hypothetical protein
MKSGDSNCLEDFEIALLTMSRFLIGLSPKCTPKEGLSPHDQWTQRYSPHGLRHLAGAALAEAGATPEQIKSILGRLTDDEARKYIQQARRKVMAADGMKLWEVSKSGR